MRNAENIVTDQLRMLECLTLAEKGAGYVSPNPMVGAIVVKDGKIVGRGFHKRFGGPHAEVSAIRQAKNFAKGGTLYVNLECCCHYGKTPPCTDAIIQSGVKRVVVGMKDPNPLVRGKGIRRLKAANIEVELGVLRRECEKMNEVFSKFITTGQPFVTLKIAQTFDGRIADSEGNSRWITNHHSRRIVHALRARYDAVLVGANTISMDNPLLTVRAIHGRNPYRVIVDGNFSSPPSSRVFIDKDKHLTFLFTSRATARKEKKQISKLQRSGIRVYPMSPRNGSTLDIHQILAVLAESNISSVLVEGGARTYAEFVRANAVDKMIIFLAPKVFGDGLSAFQYLKEIELAKALQFSRTSSWNLGGDLMIEAYLRG